MISDYCLSIFVYLLKKIGKHKTEFEAEPTGFKSTLNIHITLIFQ